ncbi:hypothetical protein E4U61_000271 [Claviceps capensis]|nr:hypothetical protein E4U61_000271 [Claviceps capensis]
MAHEMVAWLVPIKAACFAVELQTVELKTFCTLCSHGGGHSQHIEIEEHFEVQAPTKSRKCKFNNFVSECWSFGFSFQFFDLSRLERRRCTDRDNPSHFSAEINLQSLREKRPLIKQQHKVKQNKYTTLGSYRHIIGLPTGNDDDAFGPDAPSGIGI